MKFVKKTRNRFPVPILGALLAVLLLAGWSAPLFAQGSYGHLGNRWSVGSSVPAAPGLLDPPPSNPQELRGDLNSSRRSLDRFWIGDTGPTEPMFTGPKQYPFICATVDSNLGQPLVDNQDGIGNAVFGTWGDPDTIVGYSENCSIKTRVDYFYFNGSTFLPFNTETDFDSPPGDLFSIPVNGNSVPFVVRVEAGTINRFLYTIAMLAPFPESTTTPQTLKNGAWNNKLIYYMRGGVGIGHYQGEATWHGGIWGAERAVFPLLLGNGYAVVTSSANETGVHYNLRLAEETALMVKRHFKATYGRPEYTVGIGASGGAIQQYVIGQNNKEILDAGIPLYSYPDMVTQAIHVGDCNLLEQYFLEEVLYFGSAFWAQWSNRKLIEGLNTSDTFNSFIPPQPGSSECIEGWWFAEPFVMNPKFTDPSYIQALQFYQYPAEEIAKIRWTHWGDLTNIYGVKDNGFEPVPFDNEGVQYGLKALTDGDINASEFIRINACVGSWKEQPDYVSWNPGADPFDSVNMNRSTSGCRDPNPETFTPAARRNAIAAGDSKAMTAAYTSGQVFIGDIDIPLIDLRPYLEEELNMHNTRQSFSVRQRMLNHDGDASNMVIWFTQNEAHIPTRIMEALQVLDNTLKTGVRPAEFTDACFNDAGALIAAGSGVWDGILDANAPGACTQSFKIYSSSRMVAGDSYSGDMFKCALKPLAAALADGTYGDVAFSGDEVSKLNKTFSTGVCDYSKPDVGKPAGF